jgi:hypothetical protein
MSGAGLPADSTLNNGSGNFMATFKTAGNQRLTATDTASSFNGSATANVVAAAASKLVLTAPATAETTKSFNFKVTAQDPYGNTATSYTGTVHFTSTDTGLNTILPADSTLTQGSKIFAATLTTLGTEAITATDTVTSSITGQGSVSVSSNDPLLHMLPGRTIRMFRPVPPVIVASFTDDDTSETGKNITVSIDWGDGSAADTSASIIPANNGGVPNLFNVVGSHQYKTKGKFTIRVTITDSQAPLNSSCGSGVPCVVTSTVLFGPRNISF